MSDFVTPDRSVCVLFADICDSTKIYESVGDKLALEAIARCLDVMRAAVETGGGRVVKTIGDEILAVFPEAAHAAFSANSMHNSVDELPPVGNTKLGLRTGFHFGPVIQQQSDIFGDTVNLAARLVKQAGRDQIILSSETASLLGPVFAPFKRPLYGIHVKGKSEEVQLCELVWNQRSNLTVSASSGTRTNLRIAAPTLRLRYEGAERIFKRREESISIGRESDCTIVIGNTRASRRHCQIQRRQDKFILVDQSTNGTYVSPDGAPEIELRREEVMLGSHGWIAIGGPRETEPPLIEYFVD